MYIIDEKSKVYKKHKLFLWSYIGLVVLFLLITKQNWLNINLYATLAICFMSVFCALDKSKRISLWIINERSRKDKVCVPMCDEKPIMFAPTMLCFVNYAVFSLTLVVCCELILDKSTRTLLWNDGGWIMAVWILLGFGVFLYGNFLEKNSANLFDIEPELLEKEYAARKKKVEDCEFHERNNLTWREPKGGIDGFNEKHDLLESDALFLWLVVLLIIVSLNIPNNNNDERNEYYEYYNEEEEYHDYFN